MSLRPSLAALVLTAVLAPAQSDDVRTLAPYVPSPDPVVIRMLELGGLRQGELHFDLGSGDGRFVLAAAGRFGARSVGFEIDPALAYASSLAIRTAGLAERARVEQKDLYTADFRQVDLITAYLLPAMLAELEPILDKHMKPGSRLVSHDYPIPGWSPAKVVSGADPDNGLPYQIFLYRR